MHPIEQTNNFHKTWTDDQNLTWYCHNQLIDYWGAKNRSSNKTQVSHQTMIMLETSAYVVPLSSYLCTFSLNWNTSVYSLDGKYTFEFEFEFNL